MNVYFTKSLEEFSGKKGASRSEYIRGFIEQEMKKSG